MDRQHASVHSKIFANKSLDPISCYGLPDLFLIQLYPDVIAKNWFSRENDNEIVAVVARPVFG